jgi:chondroitin 4-sulfotransferase 11
MFAISKHGAQYERIKTALRDSVPIPYAWRIKGVKAASRLHQRFFENFAFIHINKCGGTSLERALGIPFLDHDTALERRAFLGAREWDKRFKLTLVRHPYDRVTSHYLYERRDEPASEAQLLGEFPAWLDRWERANKAGPARWDASMHSWIADHNGDLLVDRIYRLEKINEAVADISQAIGREMTLHHIKSKTQGLDRKVLLTSEVKERIYHTHRIDFDTFGYTA